MTTFFLVNKNLRGFAGREEISAQPSLIDTRRLVLLTHGDSSWRLCSCMLHSSTGNTKMKIGVRNRVQSHPAIPRIMHRIQRRPSTPGKSSHPKYEDITSIRFSTVLAERIWD